MRPGGAWRYEWQGQSGEAMELEGEYREVEPPRRLVNTEHWGGDWPEAVDTMELTSNGGRTVIQVTVRAADAATLDRMLATGMEEGWAKSYERLDAHLRTHQGRGT